MIESLGLLGSGFLLCLTPINLLCAFLGVFLGTLAGVLPGLGISGTVAILLPITYGMDPLTALIMVSGIFFGAQYGGAITSVLVNIPGEATSIVTTFDGYPLARKGMGGKALGIAAISSFIGGTVGLLFLTFCASWLARVAVSFGKPEFFAIVIFGLFVLTNVGGKKKVKSMIMLCFGLLLGCVGLDDVFGTLRFTFGNTNLYGGINFVVFVMGVFGITELIKTVSIKEDKGDILSFKFRDLYPTKEDFRKVWKTIARGSIFGFLVGLVPGPGSILATFGSYGIEKKLSKHPELLGTGVLEGVAAPESANNASMYAQMVPLLSLGLPFSSSVALLMSAFILHGITPGPMLITAHPEIFWGLIASMFIGNIMLLVINLPLVGIWASMLKIDFAILMPIITIITFTGGYAINNRVFELGLMVVLGFIGFFLNVTGYDLAAACLGVFLCGTLEDSLCGTMTLYHGSLIEMMANRPVAAVILLLAVFIVLFTSASSLRAAVKKRLKKRMDSAQE